MSVKARADAGGSGAEPVRVLVIGASYGLLIGAKIAAAGHRVTMVGRQDEIEAMARGGVAIEFGEGQRLCPPMGLAGLHLAWPDEVHPQDFDLVFLAVQEPQVHAAPLATLLRRLGGRVPVASIMNMPPPGFLARLPALPADIGAAAYADREIWSALPARRMTLASPDPQAFRPDPARPGLLRVTLASNFKFAPFDLEADQKILVRVARDASRLVQPWGRVPVQLLARSSVYVPLAKWPMLVTGNCRSYTASGQAISIAEAVGQNPAQSRALYDSVVRAVLAIGAPPEVLVPFDAYLAASQRLVRPSSLARALTSGAVAVERIDLIVLDLLRAVGADQGPDAGAVAALAQISDAISARLLLNRGGSGPQGSARAPGVA